MYLFKKNLFKYCYFSEYKLKVLILNIFNRKSNKILKLTSIRVHIQIITYKFINKKDRNFYLRILTR